MVRRSAFSNDQVSSGTTAAWPCEEVRDSVLGAPMIDLLRIAARYAVQATVMDRPGHA